MLQVEGIEHQIPFYQWQRFIDWATVLQQAFLSGMRKFKVQSTVYINTESG